MVKKLVLFALFLILLSGTNLPILSQESFDLEILWQKEVFPKEIKFAQFSADGQWIYAATGSGIEKISAETGDFVSTFDKNGLFTSSSIWGMDISGLGNLIVTYDGGNAVNIWDTRSEKATKYLPFKISDSSNGALAVAISPDEKYLVVSSIPNDNPPNEKINILIYDVNKEMVIKTISFDYIIRTIKFSHNGKYFATGGEYTGYDSIGEKDYDQVILWSTETWSPVDTIEQLEGNGSGYSIFKFSLDDKLFSCVRLTPPDLRIYNLETKEIIMNPGKNYYNVEILHDNTYFLLSFAKSSNNYSTDLYRMNSIVRSFYIPTGICCVHNSQEYWKVFCCATGSPIFLLSNNTTKVIESNHENIQYIYIFLESNKLILQTENITDNSLLLEVYDIQGSIVFSKTIITSNPNNIYSVPIDLISGIYFCKVTAGENTYTHKFQIVR